jgi:DNA-binding response OmpR family regulator
VASLDPVLVVEGDRRVRTALARSLRRCNLRVVLALSGADALDLAAAERPSLLLLDTTVPGWLDVAATLRAEFAGLPILLTGPPRRSSAYYAPTNQCYIAGPLDPDVVAAQVAVEVALATAAAPPMRLNTSW